MTTQELITLLETFIQLPGENKVVEFKKALNGFDTQKIGEYFSALSNEANLRQEVSARLLFGIHDKTHAVLGSSYRPERPSLDALKREIAEGTNCGITFTEIHEVTYQGKRVVMFQIPAAPTGVPTSYKGHFYGRDGESLVALSLHKLETIRRQSKQTDWSAQIIPHATIDDLDKQAIETARSLYMAKNKQNAAEIAAWDTPTFLNKAKLTIKGGFIPQSISNVLKDDAPEEVYRNPFLAQAMVGLQMVDTIGSGIRKMFNYQRQRLFPLPDYEIEKNRVQVTIIGKILNMEYANILAKKQNLSLVEIEALNRIQLSHPISDEEVSHLRRKKLIEGRKPNLFIAKPVAQQLNPKTAYSNNKGFEDSYYCDLILKSLTEHGMLTKKEITQLLWNKLPNVLSDAQKCSKVGNLLTKLRKQNKIKNISRGVHSDWFLKEE